MGAAPGVDYRPGASTGGLVRRRSRVMNSQRLRCLCMPFAVAALAFGSWHAASAVHLHAKAVLGQRLLLRTWHAAQASGAPAKPWPWADTHPVARLLVPGHGVDLLVLSGANGRTLAWGPGHLDGSGLPGMRGNAIVTAHRDTHFAFLRAVRHGERIVVETAAGARTTYRVERQFIADHRALKLPAGDDDATLSLVTCYPFDAIDPGTPLRYAVVARAEPASGGDGR